MIGTGSPIGFFGQLVLGACGWWALPEAAKPVDGLVVRSLHSRFADFWNLDLSGACRVRLPRKNVQRSGIAGVCYRGGYPVKSVLIAQDPEVGGVSVILGEGRRGACRE
jgi:hypothetical protein